MPVTPSGSMSLAQEHFRVTIADCATFRSLVNAADRPAALAHLYHEGLPPPSNGSEHTAEEHDELRPWGIVFTDEHRGFQRRVVSTGGFRSSGRLRLRLCRSCDDLTDLEPTSDAMLEWKNIVGQIIAELCAHSIAGDPDHLVFDEIAVEYGPFASHPELAPTQGIFQGVELSVSWGGQ